MKLITVNVINYSTILSLVFFLGFFLQETSAQMYVQLEVYNSAYTKKYAPGSQIVFKSKEFPKSWQKRRIESINYEDNFILFTNGYIMVDDITEVRTFNPLPFSLAKGLYIFSLRALIFGGITDLIDGKLNTNTVLYTVLPVALGVFLDKISYKKYRLGKTARLRLLDLRMF